MQETHDPRKHQKRLLILALLGLAFCLGLFSRNSVEPPVNLPVRTQTASAVIAKPRKVSRVTRSMNHLSLNREVRSYTYVFTGRATCDGRPCSNTRIDLLMTSPEENVTRYVQTNDEGRYEVAVAIESAPNGMVRWEIKSESEEMMQGSAEGHQIPTDDPRIEVEVPLLLASI